MGYSKKDLTRAKNDYVIVEEEEKENKKLQCWSITPNGKIKKYPGINFAVQVIYNKEIKQSHNTVDKKNIKKKILKAINNNTRYRGKNWKLV